MAARFTIEVASLTYASAVLRTAKGPRQRFGPLDLDLSKHPHNQPAVKGDMLYKTEALRGARKGYLSYQFAVNDYAAGQWLVGLAHGRAPDGDNSLGKNPGKLLG